MCILRITEVGVKAAMVGLKPFDGDAPRVAAGPPCVVVGERALQAGGGQQRVVCTAALPTLGASKNHRATVGGDKDRFV